MSDADRVLSLLIHDLRTPLGVAHGYLRLIRADKLPTPADRDRALAGTQEALARISRLCADASAFLDDTPPAGGRAPALELVDRVAAVLDERGIPLDEAEQAAGAVTVGISLDRAADAIVTLLASRAQKPLAASARIAVGPAELRFLCGPPSGNGTAIDTDGADGVDGARPFDPWQSAPSLPVVLAHRVVTGLGGRIWTLDGGRRIALALPLESRNE
jgi:hypothetical protein